MKIAILGAGLGSVGSYLGLSKINKEFNVSIYNSKNNEPQNIQPWNKENIKLNYSNLFSQLKLKNITTKSNFGNYLSKNGIIWESNISFGLSKYWGGVLQIPNEKLYYKIFQEKIDKKIYLDILNSIPATKPSINLFDGFFDEKSFSQNQIKIHPIIQKVSDKFDKFDDFSINFKFGINSVALKTNSYDLNNCINCANCIIGCPKNSFFTSENFFENKKMIYEEIINVNLKENQIVTKKSKMNYDKIIFNLGPFYNQKYLLDNFEIKKEIIIKDSYSYTLPIFFLGNYSDIENYFALTNFLSNFCNTEGVDEFTIQFFPPTNHIINSLTKGNPGFFLKYINSKFLRRFIFARIYLNDEYIKKISYLDGKVFKISFKDNKKIKNHIYKKLKKILNKDFYVINYPIESSTSSHYTGYNKNLKDIYFESKYTHNSIVPDSTFWECNPSISPSLSIIAGSYSKVKNSKIFNV